jgi:DMSO reductase anchor subunit
MMEPEDGREWPLIIFTMGLQWACGLSFAATLFEYSEPSFVQLVRPLGIAVFPILVVSVISSLFHLGQPRMAWKSFRNLAHSRLSIEILIVSVFAIAALFESTFWLTGKAEFRLVVGTGATILGLAAMASSAMIYTLRNLPAWNSWWLPASFVGATALLGGISVIPLLAWSASTVLWRFSLIITIAGGILSLFAAIRMSTLFAQLARRDFSGLSAAPRRRRKLWWLFGSYALLAGVLPITFAVLLLSARNAAPENSAFHSAVAVLVLTLIGLTFGRLSMYSMRKALTGF